MIFCRHILRFLNFLYVQTRLPHWVQRYPPIFPITTRIQIRIQKPAVKTLKTKCNKWFGVVPVAITFFCQWEQKRPACFWPIVIFRILQDNVWKNFQHHMPNCMSGSVLYPKVSGFAVTHFAPWAKNWIWPAFVFSALDATTLKLF